MISRKQIGLILLPFLSLLTLLYLSMKKDMAISLTPVELEVYRYTRGAALTGSSMKKRVSLDAPPGAAGPLYIEEKRSVPGAAGPGDQRGYTVSFILISKNDRIAIINNAIVREGDILDNRKVSTIEKDKVAITLNGITTWVKLEDQ